MSEEPCARCSRVHEGGPGEWQCYQLETQILHEYLNKTKWTSVNDRLPWDVAIVLASDGNFVGQAYFDRGEWEWSRQSALGEPDPTHWMPLPDPPNVSVQIDLPDTFDPEDVIILL